MPFEKNWSLKVVLAVLLSVPSTVMLPLLLLEANTGKFWRLFAPVSPSPRSLSVTPPSPRSIPSPLFEKIELERMALPVPEATLTADVPLAAMMSRAPATYRTTNGVFGRRAPDPDAKLVIAQVGGTGDVGTNVVTLD